MINFRDPKDQVPSLLAVVGMGLMAASVVGLFILPTIPTKPKLSPIYIEAGKVETAKKRAEEDIDKDKALMSKHLWTSKPADVTPVALAKISEIVASTKLNLISFRPQKGVESAALLQLQYNLAVDGPYTNVATLLDRIEKSDAKLAVNSVQYAAAEGESDKVTATIGLVAFSEIPKKNSDPKPTAPKTEDVKKSG